MIDVLASMGNEFSSHEFIRKLMLAFPDRYVSNLLALYEKRTHRPLATLHGLIGKALTHYEDEFIERLGRSKSRNLWGKTTSNQEWRKVKP